MKVFSKVVVLAVKMEVEKAAKVMLCLHSAGAVVALSSHLLVT